MTLARTKAIAKRTTEAWQLLEHLHAMLDGGAHRRFVAQVWAEEIRLALVQKETSRAWSLAREYGLEPRGDGGEWRMQRPYDESWERAGSAYATLLAHSNRVEEARLVLEVLRDSAREAGYAYREIRLEGLLACCCWRTGDWIAAFDALNRALSLTRGCGFTRGVFDEAPGLAPLMKTAIERRKIRCLPPERFLRKFENVYAGRSAAPAGTYHGKAALPLEPLTDREIDILRLLARGFSNSQISERADRPFHRQVASEECVCETRREHAHRRPRPRARAATD